MSKAAVAVSDELDSLSNNDLRAKCLEYGLPNVPITDTSRKLLIKRLRTAIDGGGNDNKSTPTKSKSRRETVHVVLTKEIESDREASPKKTRGASARRTIGTVRESEPIEPTVEVSVREVTNRRRSRTTPTPAEPTPVITTKRKASVIVEDDEDETDDVVLVHDNRGQVLRSSRSPSLAKSKLVTTSYKHIVAEEPIEEEQSYSPRETIIPVRREASYEPKSSFATIEREARSSSLFTRPIEAKRTLEQLSRPLDQLSRPSLSSPSRNYTTQTANTSSTSQRYTTSGFKPQADYNSPINNSYNYRAPSASSYRREPENSDEDEQLDAPFLSDFARRLSRLKADPFSPGLASAGRGAASQYRESQRYYTTSIAGRRGINNSKDSLGESIRSLWVALDCQYGLRKYLAVIAIALVVLFIYIMLVQN